MNLSAHTESHMKQSNSAFEIISRTESNEDENDNEPVKEEELKATDLNNNSAKLSRSPDRDEDFSNVETEEEKANLTDTETLFSEQKLNGQHFSHHDMDDVSSVGPAFGVCDSQPCVRPSNRSIISPLPIFYLCYHRKFHFHYSKLSTFVPFVL